MIAPGQLLNRTLEVNGPVVFLNRQQLTLRLGVSIGRIERAMARGELTADAFDLKRAPLFSESRLDDIERILNQ